MKKFSQKHYEFLAQFFAYELEVAKDVASEKITQASSTFTVLSDQTRVLTIKSTIRLLASKLEQDNPKFDRKRFYKAAGIGEENR